MEHAKFEVVTPERLAEIQAQSGRVFAAGEQWGVFDPLALACRKVDELMRLPHSGTTENAAAIGHALNVLACAVPATN